MKEKLGEVLLSSKGVVIKLVVLNPYGISVLVLSQL